MKKTLFLAVFAFLSLLLGAPSDAQANTTNISTDPSYAAGPFLFYCQPYTSTFEAGKHYQPTDGSCRFSQPNTLSNDRVIVVFRGTPGNAVAISGDLVSGDATLVQEDYTTFPTPLQGDDYFAAIFDLSLYNDLINYFQFGGTLPATAVVNQNYYVLPWKWGPKQPSEYNPVVIIPGILGSWQKNGQWVLDPILHTYDNLVDTLLANGYIENKTLFKFPYDWENPNEDTAYLLKNKIADIKTICGCSKVDLVGHSMGGLVALHYIESDGYTNDVNKLFLVATPLSGAPKAYKAWEAGDFGQDQQTALGKVQSVLMDRIFSREAKDVGYSSTFDYVHNKPISSIQELLPVFSDYLKTTVATLHYPSGYPTNLFLEQLVTSLDAKVYERGVDVKTILADTKTNLTVGGFVVASSTTAGLWADGQPVSTTFVAGDGTVPRSSIEKYLPIDKEFDFVDHTEVASTSAPYIYKGLTGNEVVSVIGKIYGFLNIDFSILINKLSPSVSDFKSLAETIASLLPNNPAKKTALFILLFSPIDMQITAPDGARLGKDFVSGNNLNEIPNALYSGPTTEHEYAIVLDPLPGQYKIQTIGTGNGPYTIATSYISTTTNVAFTAGTTTLQQIISNDLVISATTGVVTIQPQLPPAPTLTPETCIADMVAAYQNKWIGKKGIYDGLVFDCKALKVLFQTRDSIEKIPPANRSKLQNGLLTATLLVVRITLDHMDLLAKDKGNTKDAVLLINTYTTWFRNHELK